MTIHKLIDMENNKRPTHFAAAEVTLVELSLVDHSDFVEKNERISSVIVIPEKKKSTNRPAKIATETQPLARRRGLRKPEEE